MNFKRFAAVASIAAASSAVLVACSEESGSSDGGSVEGLSNTTGQLVAEGASSQQQAVDYFGVQYGSQVSGASLAYNASGSGSGRQNFVGGNVDFAGSDSPLSDEQVTKAQERCGSEAWHLPFVIGPVAVAYHLEGAEELNLSVSTVAKIFKGEINNWNDEAIASENEGVDLPDKKIQVIYRSDESGTTDNFQKFLNTAVPEEWETTGQTFPANVGSGANGSNGVASEVDSIDGAITYVEAGFAKQKQNLNVANIDFGSGPVTLDADSVGVALDNLTFTGEGNNMVVDSKALFGMQEDGAYPLVLTTYEIVCSDYANSGASEGTADRLKDFLTVALNSQDDSLAELGYIPVTGTHHDRLAEAVEAIK
ncbi:phosphate ABC transporter substrate-binding protein PstS [Corynebacterium lowii]|uniref:Phosphate-binding protein n=1 Tax=Corynebacterium lowii TaxID=1544413 RepID=A0A0Q0U8H7_9CORY|nr:phosphate ABC transporter substrate-binding protein PstS [Corynebacterium lowii]KQB83959.1 Phosphate-binding protein PstS 2 precursor [Corynebacterium lowii]MDP9852791.1 phosphate transport system substrate-binding protein [Corynebacterium lowii]